MVFLIELNEKDGEYIKLMNSNVFFKSNKKNILWVNKIVNPKNKKSYNNYKNSLVKKTEINNIYHGSDKDSFNNILQNGFMCGYNRNSVYGRGSYFSKNPDFSYDNFSKRDYENNKYLIVVDICFTETKLGDNNYETNDKNICFVNSIFYPAVYVIPNDDAILLKYIICYNNEICSEI